MTRGIVSRMTRLFENAIGFLDSHREPPIDVMNKRKLKTKKGRLYAGP